MTNQTIDFENVDDSFQQGISPNDLVHAAVIKKTDFFPWHKPRKQWVRLHQWNDSIKKLITTLKLGANTRSLSYLSLPGPDLLDVRAIQPLCAQVDVRLRFLGLNHIGLHEKALAREQALSISEVHAMSHIDQASTVVEDKFEHIANEKSVAYGRVIKDKASFDVVNVDLCSSFAATKPGENIPDYYNALFKLLRHQAESRTDDWLLFLTTRNNQDMVHPDTIDRFIASINTLLTEDANLQQILIGKNIFLESVFVDGLIDRDLLDVASFANSFLIGVGNWIVHALLDNNPKWKVLTMPVFGYHVADKSANCDMISLGFYCTRVLEPAIDSQGLAGKAVNTNVTTLHDVAKACVNKLVEKIEQQTDIDIKLHENHALYEESLESSVTLLRMARYSETDYRTWAELEKNKLISLLSQWGLVTIDVAA